MVKSPDVEDVARRDMLDRFEVLGSLGQGGMGSVSLAYDSHHRARVALKSVGHVTGAALLRFKREFRAVKGLAHPNLVSLGELFERGGQWYLTMEYVDGVSFLDHVRPPGLGAGEAAASVESEMALPSLAAAAAAAETTRTIGPTLGDTDVGEAAMAVDGPYQLGGNQGLRFDEGRLRHSLLQLVDATHTLHETKRIHRDFKPSNVLVSAGGRVVVLDFGLIGETERGVVRSTGVYGTPAYMAPEQARGGDLTPAIDCYAIGVMLFEALCGRWPVVGSVMTLLRAKQNPLASRPSELTDQELPEDLEQLCVDLLSLDPAARPDTTEIFARLGAEVPRLRASNSGARVYASRRSARPVLCIGRERELERLDQLFAATRAKRARQVLVLGESGIGKTTLVHEAVTRFSTQVAIEPWVLYGRCHEHEQVRYKAFDAIIDLLSGELPRRIPATELRALLPRDGWLLSRAFPVLHRVASFAELGHGPSPIGDRGALQKRMLIAFRELFFRLAERSHLVIVIEDLQWADTDSWALLEELSGGADAPPLTLVTTARAELTQAPPSVAAPFLATTTLDRLELGPLDLESVGRLAAAHGRADVVDIAARLRDTTGGHPLYLGVLLRDETINLGGEEPPSLTNCLLRQAQALEPAARELLEVLAVSDRALAPAALDAITGLGGETIKLSLDALHGGQWVRSASGSDVGRFGLFHSQVRAAALAWIDGERRRDLHQRLADWLADQDAELDHIVTHLLAAGARERARELAAEAADQAMDAMAFERAAELYALALERPPTHPEAGRRLSIARAHALAWSGRRVEAANTYLAAAEGAPRELELQLRSKAALHLLSSGEFGAGQPLHDAVLRELGVSIPRSSSATMMTLVRDTLMLRLTSRRVRVDADVELDVEHQLRLELCQAAHWIYSLYDLLLTGYFSTTYARLALRTRERTKVASGLSHVAGFVAYMGDHAKAKALFVEVEALLEGVDAPLVRGTVAIHESISRLSSDYDCVEQTARTRRALELLRAAGQAQRGDDLGVVLRSAAMMLARVMLAQALERSGDLRGLELLWRELVADARNSDSDRSLQVWVLVAAPFTAIHLARNRPATSLTAAAQGLELLETKEFLVPHLVALVSRMRAAVYQGQPDVAVADFEAHRDALRRSFTTRAPDLRADVAVTELCARLSLRARAGPQGRGDRELLKAIRFLERFPVTYQRGRGVAGRAALLAQDGDRDGAVAALAQALELFEGCRARALVAAVKILLPRLRDDERARELRAEGLKFFLGAEVGDPERFAAMLIPGL